MRRATENVTKGSVAAAQMLSLANTGAVASSVTTGHLLRAGTSSADQHAVAAVTAKWLDGSSEAGLGTNPMPSTTRKAASSPATT